MNDTQVNALMQLVPERFLDEAMDYHVAHAPKELFMPSAAKKTVPRRMLWIAAPVSAAACLAAVIGLCYVIGTRQPERPVESLQNEIIEEQPSAVIVDANFSEEEGVPESERDVSGLSLVRVAINTYRDKIRSRYGDKHRQRYCGTVRYLRGACCNCGRNGNADPRVRCADRSRTACRAD